MPPVWNLYRWLLQTAECWYIRRARSPGHFRPLWLSGFQHHSTICGGSGFQPMRKDHQRWRWSRFCCPRICLACTNTYIDLLTAYAQVEWQLEYASNYHIFDVLWMMKLYIERGSSFIHPNALERGNGLARAYITDYFWHRKTVKDWYCWNRHKSTEFVCYWTVHEPVLCYDMAKQRKMLQPNLWMPTNC